MGSSTLMKMLSARRGEYLMNTSAVPYAVSAYHEEAVAMINCPPLVHPTVDAAASAADPTAVAVITRAPVAAAVASAIACGAVPPDQKMLEGTAGADAAAGATAAAATGASAAAVKIGHNTDHLMF